MSEYYYEERSDRIYHKKYLINRSACTTLLDGYEVCKKLNALERQLSKLQDAYDFNLELLSEKERQLAEAGEEVKTFKYDLETLVSIVTDCVYDMSEEERYDTLKQVADHYKQLKEKG